MPSFCRLTIRALPQQTFVGALIRTTLPGSSLSDSAALGQIAPCYFPFMVMLAALQNSSAAVFRPRRR